MLKPSAEQVGTHGITIGMTDKEMQEQGLVDHDLKTRKIKRLHMFWDKMENIQGSHLGFIEDFKEK